MQTFISSMALGLIPFALVLIGLWRSAFSLTSKLRAVIGFWVVWALVVSATPL
jgi:hypothetical protein